MSQQKHNHRSASIKHRREEDEVQAEPRRIAMLNSQARWRASASAFYSPQKSALKAFHYKKMRILISMLHNSSLASLANKAPSPWIHISSAPRNAHRISGKPNEVDAGLPVSARLARRLRTSYISHRLVCSQDEPSHLTSRILNLASRQPTFHPPLIWTCLFVFFCQCWRHQLA